MTSTDMGNAYSITFHDANGKDWTVYKEECRTLLGLPSMRFSLGDGGTSSGSTGDRNVWVNGTDKYSGTDGLFAIDGNGNQSVLSGSVYIVTGDGTTGLLSPGSSSTGTSSSSSCVYIR